jgi:hypothetical protein
MFKLKPSWGSVELTKVITLMLKEVREKLWVSSSNSHLVSLLLPLSQSFSLSFSPSLSLSLSHSQALTTFHSVSRFLFASETCVPIQPVMLADVRVRFLIRVLTLRIDNNIPNLNTDP